MELYPNRKSLLLIPAVCIAFSVVFTETLTASEHDHDCTGEDCPICLQIKAAKCFLKNLKLALIGLFFAVCLVSSAQIHTNHAYFIPLLSPVALKVRFNS
ncbi:MAG: hypothetical protein FWF68_02420 [Spirochaetes bacterium]|nr:hypothetical protein [Spirochaetota bacterium]